MLSQLIVGPYKSESVTLGSIELLVGAIQVHGANPLVHRNIFIVDAAQRGYLSCITTTAIVGKNSLIPIPFRNQVIRVIYINRITEYIIALVIDLTAVDLYMAAGCRPQRIEDCFAPC